MSKQMKLFAPEPEVERRLGGGPPDVQRRMKLAFTEPVKLELIAVAAARPDEWLGWDAFRIVREKYQIGFCMGHVLFNLVRAGRLQAKTIYLGKGLEADKPGSPDYQGYKTEWKAI